MALVRILYYTIQHSIVLRASNQYDDFRVQGNLAHEKSPTPLGPSRTPGIGLR